MAQTRFIRRWMRDWSISRLLDDDLRQVKRGLRAFHGEGFQGLNEIREMAKLRNHFLLEGMMNQGAQSLLQWRNTS